MDKLIEVAQLNFNYGDKQILQNISFNVTEGEFLGVIGANGSGKSTLMKLLIKSLTPSSGNIKLFGQDIQRFKAWNQIGYVSQKAASFNSSFPATVEEIVATNLYADIGMFGFSKKEHKERVYHALEQVGMQDYRKRLIGKLSGGQQQRVFIARVLTTNPRLMLLDEPTVGIDVQSEETIYHILEELKQNTGLTIMFVTHDLGGIMNHATRMLCIGDKGIFEHNPKEGVTEAVLEEIFGVGAHVHIHPVYGGKEEEHA